MTIPHQFPVVTPTSTKVKVIMRAEGVWTIPIRKLYSLGSHRQANWPCSLQPFSLQFDSGSQVQAVFALLPDTFCSFLLHFSSFIMLPFVISNVELSCRKGPTKKLCYLEKHRRRKKCSTVAPALPVCLSEWLGLFKTQMFSDMFYQIVVDFCMARDSLPLACLGIEIKVMT